jgi:hypothetical protein
MICAPYAYQKLDLVEFRVGDGFLKMCAVRLKQNGAGFILGIASGHQR